MKMNAEDSYRELQDFLGAEEILSDARNACDGIYGIEGVLSVEEALAKARSVAENAAEGIARSFEEGFKAECCATAADISTRSPSDAYDYAQAVAEKNLDYEGAARAALEECKIAVAHCEAGWKSFAIAGFAGDEDLEERLRNLAGNDADIRVELYRPLSLRPADEERADAAPGM